MRKYLIAALFLTGCYVGDPPPPQYAAGGPGYAGPPGAEVEDNADLVEVSPGVEVVADYNESIFYADNYYWVNRGGVWYSSTWYGGGWGRAGYISPRIGGIVNPGGYAHYRPSGYVAHGAIHGGYATHAQYHATHAGGGGYHARPAVRSGNSGHHH